MLPNRLHRPTTGKFACLSVCADPSEVYIITEADQIQSALDRIWNTVWVFHHAKFDLTHLRRWASIPPRQRLVDTLIIDRILWNGYYDNFSLQDLARRYLLEHLDKAQRENFLEKESMTPEMIEYSAQDASTVLRVWWEQKKHVTNNDMHLWRWIELPALWAILDFQTFCVDVNAWQTLAEANAKRRDEIDASLPFNPRSPKQVLEALRHMGFKNLTSTGEEALSHAIRSFPDAPATKYAQLILESRMYGKRASTYGIKWLENYLEFLPEGVYGFHSDYWVIGAETSRMSTSNPPIHQIPIRDTKDFRNCFIARPGNKLIIADFSQQEIFVAAFISQDKQLIELCNSGNDIYVQMAKMVWGKDIEKKDPLRQRMKAVVLGIDYGMTKYGLAKREGITVKQAEEILRDFRNAFPDLALWIESQQQRRNFVVTPTGRKIWLNPYSGQARRNAVNAPIQGFSAEITKRTLANLHENWKWDCPFGVVGVFHDEFVLDIPKEYVEEIAEFVKTTMIETANYMCPGMTFRAECTIADNWGEK